VSGEQQDNTERAAPPAVALAALEGLVNQLLALDPEGAAALGKIQGRVLRVELDGVGMAVTVVPEANALRLFGHYDATPDCTIRATPAALLHMALAENREDQVFSGAVSIEGDNALAQAIGVIIRGLDIDWEEQLSTLVGDVLAHGIGDQVRATGRWAERSGRVLSADLREYLIEEGRLIPSESELREFLGGVDELRDDIARIEARIERLAGGDGNQGAGGGPA
jgi:ubiquinone biosynthesis protein UbiJ